MKKVLFKETCELTDEGKAFQKKFTTVVKPFVKELFDGDFDLQHVETLLTGALYNEIIMTRLLKIMDTQNG